MVLKLGFKQIPWQAEFRISSRATEVSRLCLSITTRENVKNAGRTHDVLSDPVNLQFFRGNSTAQQFCQYQLSSPQGFLPKQPRTISIV